MLCRLILVILALLTTTSIHGEEKIPFLLRIEEVSDRRILLDFPVMGGEQFVIHYIHSSDKTPVQDTFFIERTGRLVLIEEAFLWQGAGLEFQNREGSEMIWDGQWTRVRLHRPLPDFVIRVGRVANQVLTFRDWSIRLDQLAKPGEGLLLSVVPMRRKDGR